MACTWRALPLVAVASFEVIGPLAQAFGLQDANEAAAEPAVRADRCAARGRRRARRTATTAQPPGPRTAPGIDIRGLRFRYGPDEPLVLDGLDLSVAAGQQPRDRRTERLGQVDARQPAPALLGLRRRARSGSAAATSATYGVDEIRRLLGVVPQDVHLFDATIRDNLAVADADVTDEQIEAACRMAQVHDFIETLPGRLRDARRRERRPAERRRAPAPGHRPGDHQGRPDPDPRRGDGQPRRRHRGRAPRFARAVHGRPDHDRHLASGERRRPDRPAAGPRLTAAVSRPAARPGAARTRTRRRPRAAARPRCDRPSPRSGGRRRTGRSPNR